MSPNERITTVAGLTTAATKIDTGHNLRANKYRLVSSDGVLFTVSADTLQHMQVLASHALWDLARSAAATGDEIVLSDEDFEHSKSVRLLLDLLVQGIAGREKYPLENIPDVVDLTLKYDCRCAYELCMAYLDFAIKTDPSAPVTYAVYSLAAQLNEVGIAKNVVRTMASQYAKGSHTERIPWTAAQATRLPPAYLWAISRALPNSAYWYSSLPEDAAQRLEQLLRDAPNPDASTAKDLRSAARKAQKPWADVPAKRAATESPSWAKRGRGR